MQLRGQRQPDLPDLLAAVRGRVRPLRAATARQPSAGPRDQSVAVAIRPRCAAEAPAAACGQQRRLVVPTRAGSRHLRRLRGLLITHACALCGVEDKLFEKGRCARCSLRQRAAALVRDLAGQDAASVPSR